MLPRMKFEGQPDSSRRLTLACLLLAAFAPSCSHDKSTASDAPVNVVLIVLDTLRADYVLDPEQAVASPSIDALAADGTSFTHAFSHAPMTLPSHTALFSSRLPHSTGIALNHQQLPDELPLLAEWVGERGYQTSAVISLATLGSKKGLYGLERGFARYDIDYLGPIPAAPVTHARLIPELQRLAAAEEPFFLFAHYSDPHLPYNVHDGSVDRRARIELDGELIAEPTLSQMSIVDRQFDLEPGEHVFELNSEFPFRYDATLDFDSTQLQFLAPQEGDFVTSPRGAHTYLRMVTRWNNASQTVQPLKSMLWLGEEPSHAEKLARYPGELEFVDRYVGELMAELKRLELYDDSLIVLTSDHGEALGEHDYWGHSLNLYDELLHVPLVIKLPQGHTGESKLRELSEAIVSHVDLAPTILEVLELPALSGQMGASLLHQSPTERAPMFAATHLPEAVAGDGSGKIGEDLISLRDAQYKLIYTRTHDRFEMYDLGEDPGELDDVFASRGAERQEWQEQLRAAAGSLGEVDFQAVFRGATAADGQTMGALGYGGSESDEN